MELIIGSYNVLIYSEVLDVMAKFTQHQPGQAESGGIILGKIVQNQFHFTNLSTPTELDKKSRFNFERHRLSAQIVINYEFYASGGQKTYFGEWHTHPERIPSPSHTDKTMILEQWQRNQKRVDFLFLLIRGTTHTYLGLQNEKELINEIHFLNPP
jgi:integrative and conjugative element protein (TIGR02256 family)